MDMDTLSCIVTTAHHVYDLAGKVQANKAQCKELSERVELVTDRILQAQKMNQQDELASIDLFCYCSVLSDIHKYMSKLSDYHNLKSEILNFFRTKSVGSEIKHLNKQLDQVAHVLNLSYTMPVALIKEDIDALKFQMKLFTSAQEKSNPTVMAWKESDFMQEVEEVKLSGGHPITTTQHEISSVELEDLVQIGQGSFGQMFVAKYYGESVAVKKLLVRRLSDNSLKEFTRELRIMEKLNHGNITRYRGGCTQHLNHVIVMERMTDNLSALIHSTNDFDWSLRIRCAIDMTRGLKYLHYFNPAILHRDLKPANVLLDSEHHCKLADFGLALTKHEIRTRVQQDISNAMLRYLAPELMSAKVKFTEKSDIFALGMIMWELSSRKIPYEDVKSTEVMSRVKAGDREQLQDSAPSAFNRIIVQCWAQDPNERPTAERLLDLLLQIKL